MSHNLVVHTLQKCKKHKLIVWGVPFTLLAFLATYIYCSFQKQTINLKIYEYPCSVIKTIEGKIIRIYPLEFMESVKFDYYSGNDVLFSLPEAPNKKGKVIEILHLPTEDGENIEYKILWLDGRQSSGLISAV